jgi:hypothetical protein
MLQLFSMIKSEDGIKRRGDFFWSVVDFSFEKDTIGHIFTVQYYGLQVHPWFLVEFLFVWSLVFCVVFFRSLSVNLAIVLSVLLQFTASDYTFGILWPLYCLSFNLQLLITPLVSCGHCIVCPSSIYLFWLHLWYLQPFLFLRTSVLMMY